MPSGSRERRAKAVARCAKARRCSSRCCARTAEVADLAAELAASGLATAIGDSATAVFLAGGAARSAYWAVRSNLEGGRSRRPRRGRWLQDGLGLLERTEAAEWRVRQLLSERVR